MAATSLHLIRAISSLRCSNNAHPTSKPAPSSLLPTRRQCLVLLTCTTTSLTTLNSAYAQDIPLFGIRKKLKKAEEEVVEVVKEGFETAEKGIEAAEKGVEAVEEGFAAAESEVETAVSFGGLVQAGAVAGAEVVGVVVATSVVNGILGPEAQNS